MTSPWFQNSISVGDIVQVTGKYLHNDGWFPCQMIEDGHPNRFTVSAKCILDEEVYSVLKEVNVWRNKLITSASCKYLDSLLVRIE